MDLKPPTGPVPRVTETMSQSEAASLQSVAAELRSSGPAHRCTAAIIQDELGERIDVLAQAA